MRVGEGLLCIRGEGGVCYGNVVVKRSSVSVVDVEHKVDAEKHVSYRRSSRVRLFT